MLKYRQKIGRLGEEYAISHLEKGGYKILKTNYRAGRLGEIDIVAIDEDTLVFVEVKTRLSKKYGEPEEAIDSGKLNRIKRAAQYFKNVHPNTPNTMRIDAVSIIIDPLTYIPLDLQVFKNVLP